jgi:hypothetical protein
MRKKKKKKKKRERERERETYFYVWEIFVRHTIFCGSASKTDNAIRQSLIEILKLVITASSE